MDIQDAQAAETAAFLKLIANKNRLMILCRLAQKDACVSDLEDLLNLSQPALSQHLARLRAEGVLTTRRSGQQIYYSIVDPRVRMLLPILQDVFCDK